MAAFLFRVLLVIFLLYIARSVLRRILSNVLPPKSSPKSDPRVIRGVMIKDPVCGTYVDVQVALTSRKDGQNFYFCSEACRQRFSESKTA
jgi:YHS domain-containing protein